jgi:hypothetical protein
LDRMQLQVVSACCCCPWLSSPSGTRTRSFGSMVHAVITRQPSRRCPPPSGHRSETGQLSFYSRCAEFLLEDQALHMG